MVVLRIKNIIMSMIIFTLVVLVIVLFIVTFKFYKKEQIIVSSTIPVENRIIVLDAGHRTDLIMELQVMKE